MYEVTYVVDGVMRKMMVNANDGVTAQNMFTNMYRGLGIEIINIRRV